MLFPNNFSFFVIIFILFNIEVITSKKCENTLSIRECSGRDGHIQHSYEMSKMRRNRFVCDFSSSCAFDKITYNWKIEGATKIDKPNNKLKNLIIIRPYEIKTGDHNVSVTVIAGDTKITSVCAFKVYQEKPMPFITGGRFRKIPALEDMSFTAIESVNLENYPNQSAPLDFRWTCTDNFGGNWSSTVNFTGPNITIPGYALIKGYWYRDKYGESQYKYPFIFPRVHMRVPGKNNPWVHYEVNVTTTNGKAPIIHIKCLKNCVPATPEGHAYQRTCLVQKCIRNCGKRSDSIPFWSSTWSKVLKMQYSSRNSTRYFVYEEEFDYNLYYLIGAHHWSKTNPTNGTFSDGLVETYNKIRISQCRTIPARGNAITTIFKVTCGTFALQTRYINNPAIEIVMVSNTQAMIIERKRTMKGLRVRLPSNRKILVHVIQEDNIGLNNTLEVNVRPAFSKYESLDVIKRKTANFYKDIEKNLKYNNWLEALQLMVTLSEELSSTRIGDDDVNDYKKIIKLKMLQNISDHFPLETMDQIRQTVSLVTRLFYQDRVNSDPDLAVLGTPICKRAAERQMEYIDENPFPTSIGSEIRDISNEITVCLEANIIPNYPAIMPKDYTFNYSTPFPVITLDVIVEDYDDYMDHHGVVVNIKKYQNASEIFIETCFINGRAIAKTLLVGEREQVTSTRYTELVVMRADYKDLPKKFDSNKIRVKLSEDILNSTDKYQILMCTTTQDPFFWTFEKVSSSILFMKVYNEDKKKYISLFDDPLKISFRTNTPKQFSYASTILSTVQKERHMGIHRFDVKIGENFFVEFDNLHPGDIFQYVITIDTRPALEDFTENMTVTAKDNIIYYVNYNEEDTWYYISVLPSHEMVHTERSSSDVMLKYGVSVYTILCKHWSSEEGLWQLSDNALNISSPDVTYCKFYNLSTVASFVIFNHIVLQSSIYLDFEMVLVVDWKIFICTAILYVMFALSLIYIASDNRTKPKIACFLCDTPHNCRYGYLLIVKTGGEIFSGTTSNICVKLYGENYISNAHVLNYPDPELRLLQKNSEDWFVFATEKYLDKITSIELWFDSIGRNPSWYCKEITIYDLQNNKNYYFEIEDWLRLVPEPNVIIKSKHKTLRELRKSKPKISGLNKFFQSWNNPHLWNLTESLAHDNLTYFRRICLMLSISLTICSLEIFLYFLPNMVLNDGFTLITRYQIYGFVLWRSILSIFITLLIHFTLLLIFRNSEMQFERLNENKSKKIFGFGMTIFCWILLTILILGNTTIILCFGFWIPSITTWMLLTSAIAGIFIYVFILENINRSFKTLSRMTRLKIDYVKGVFVSVVRNVEHQRKLLYKAYGPHLLRPHLKHLYRYLDLTDVRKKRGRQQNFLEIMDFFQDFAMFFFYILLIYLMVFLNRNSWTYYAHQEAVDLFSGTSTRSQHLFNVTSFATLMLYNEFTIIWALQSFQWYNRYILFNPGMMIDQHNKYLGIARFRQQRAVDIDCPIPEQMRYLNINCLSIEPTENRDFGQSWNLSLDDPGLGNRLNESWFYVSPNQLEDIKIKGKLIKIDKGELMTYRGGGYVGPLGRTLHNSLVNNQLYRTKHWVDKYTRVLFMEVLLYNANCNLFNTILVLIEREPTGNIRREIRIKTEKLIYTNPEIHTITLISYGILIFLCLSFTMKAFSRLIGNCADFWNILDLLIAILSFAFISTFLLRMIAVGNFLSLLETTRRNKFLYYFGLLIITENYKIFAAFLICLATIRLWKWLRIALIFKIFEKTLAFAIIQIIHLMFIHFIILLTFAITGYLLFGNFSKEFQNIYSALATMGLLSIRLKNNFNYDILNYVHNFCGYLFYFMFVIIMLLIHALYVITILVSYGRAKAYYTTYIHHYNVVDYLKDEFNYLISWSKMKIKNIRKRKTDLTSILIPVSPKRIKRGKQENREIEKLKERLREREREKMSKYEKRVLPRRRTIRFSRAYSMNKNTFELMKCLALCRIIRNYGLIPQELMLKTLYYYLQKDVGPKDVFYRNRYRSLEGGDIYVEDRRIEEIESITETILSSSKLTTSAAESLYNEIVQRHQGKFKQIDDMLKAVLIIFNNIDVNLEGRL